jgi:hypothetical protein
MVAGVGAGGDTTVMQNTPSNRTVIGEFLDPEATVVRFHSPPEIVRSQGFGGPGFQIGYILFWECGSAGHDPCRLVRQVKQFGMLTGDRRNLGRPLPARLAVWGAIRCEFSNHPRPLPACLAGEAVWKAQFPKLLHLPDKLAGVERKG